MQGGGQVHFVSQNVQAEESGFITAFKTCAQRRDLCRGVLLHAHVLKRGLLETSCHVANTLISTYAKCSALSRARSVLDELPTRDVISWSALIAGYAQHGHGQNALDCLVCMRDEGISPDPMTFTCILKACGSIRALNKGQQIHEEISKQGLLEKDIVLGNAVIDMYAKCSALTKAKQVLAELPTRDVVSWSTIITGFALQGQGEQALGCFEQMQNEGIVPDVVTFISLLKACSSVEAIHKGKQIHDVIVREGLLVNNVVLGSALVDMYAKCGDLAKAQRVLKELPIRNVVSWSALITGYAQRGLAQEALDCFEQMKRDGLSPNDVTLMSLLKACGTAGAIAKGECIHNEIARLGLLGKILALDTALVDMYVRCHAFSKAHQILDDLPVCDVVLWNALVGGYARQGQGEEALNCFELMQRKGISPDIVSFTCILKACGSLGAADKGKQVHDEVAKQGLLGRCVALDSALVDMYTKCGALSKARQLLEELPFVDIVSWSSLIAGYAWQGQCQEALNCIKQMECKGHSPNAVTFSCVLTACSHTGLVQEGESCFVDMTRKFGIAPDVEHYVCLIDMFGRAGHFDKAVATIGRMPSSDHLAAWSALLGSCRQWGEVDIGRWAFDHAIQLDKCDATSYIDMTNLYIGAGLEKQAESIEALRVQNRACLKATLGSQRESQ